MTTTDRKPAGMHAVVIGGSLGGLMAARVLNDYFERVTILEKDCFPAPGEHRKGVPHGRHAHGLLAGGFRAMQSLFPGLEEELIAAGALPGDVVGDIRWHQFGRYKAKFESGLRGVALSRPLLEAAIRQRVHALPGSEIHEGTSVRGLLTTPDHRRVTGVRLQHNGEDGREELRADLVLNATGRGAGSLAWLEALGYARPDEEKITIKIGYATRIYRRRPEDLAGDNGVVISAIPPHHKRGGVILAIEEDRWMMTLAGFLGDHPPTDEAGYLAFARSLPAPDLYEVIQNAEPLSEIVSYTFPANLRRRYERLHRFPEGYLVFGDALCSFNPVYGQGMSVAAMEALALHDCLKAQRRNGSFKSLPRRFFKQAAAVIDIPWELAAGADFAYPEAEGKRPTGTNLINRYIERVHTVASHDKVVCRAFFDVINLLKPPGHLFKPGVALRVLRRWRSGSARSFDLHHQ